MSTPILVDVTIILEKADDIRPNDSYVVTPVWGGVDRPTTHSISTAQNLALAKRLQRAMLDGAVFNNPHILTDNGGQTYVASGCRVMGRHLDRDLKNLGY